MYKLDLNILKAIIGNRMVAMDFAYRYNHEIFHEKLQPFARMVVSYIKVYRSLPSKRTLIERHSTEDVEKYINFVWDKLDNIEYDIEDYPYDLEQLKKRHTEQSIIGIKDKIADKILDGKISNSQDFLNEIYLTVQKTQGLFKSQGFIQQSLKDFATEFEELYKAKEKDPLIGLGIPTGYHDIDAAIDGLHPTELMVIGGASGSGKMLPLDTSIPTINGMKLMKDIHAGDYIFGNDGKSYQVLAESEVLTEEGWEFTFSDGNKIISHDNHLWWTIDAKERVSMVKLTDEYRKKRRRSRPSRDTGKHPWQAQANKNRTYKTKKPSNGSIKSTLDIANTLKTKNKRKESNHAITLTKAIELPHKKLLVDPYVLGLWLGDGTAREGNITTADHEIVPVIKKAGYDISKKYYKTNNKAITYAFKKLRMDLKAIGVLRNKHIPHDYLWSSKKQRLALLQGLMDADGTADKTGHSSFCNTNKFLIDGVIHLLESLGQLCSVREKQSKLYGVNKKMAWIVNCTPTMPVFRIDRKLKRQKKAKNRLDKRYIVSAKRVKAMPMKCIQVASPNNLYLAGKHFIPTHNSMLLNNIAVQMWMGENTIYTDPGKFIAGHNVLYFSLEMPYDLCFNRTMANIADVRSRELKKGKLDKDEAARVQQSLEFIKNYPNSFEIVDIPRNVDINQIELRFEDAKHKYDPEIIVVDYLGLMDDDSPVADWLKLGIIAGKLHEFARAHNIILLTAVQLNDGTDDKMKSKGKVGLHRIGRSRLISHNANVVLQIEDRKDEHEYDDFFYHLIKNRDAPAKHKCYLRKKFTHATLLNPGMAGGESDREDISDLVNKAHQAKPDGYDGEFISED